MRQQPRGHAAMLDILVVQSRYQWGDQSWLHGPRFEAKFEIRFRAGNDVYTDLTPTRLEPELAAMQTPVSDDLIRQWMDEQNLRLRKIRKVN